MADSSSPAVSPRFALRAATAEAHEHLDNRFSTFDLADRDQYGRFLLAQAGAFFPVEEALEAAGVADLIDDWPARKRSDALRSDLAALGLAEPDPVPSPAFTTEAEILGGLYVLEGSRLGGAMLVRSVPDTSPKIFLTPGNPAAWRAFVAVLDQRLSSQADIDEAARAATSVFEAFGSSASRVLGNDET